MRAATSGRVHIHGCSGCIARITSIRRRCRGRALWAAEEGEQVPSRISADWRDVRAQLVRQWANPEASAAKFSPELWAHALPRPEKGALVIATPYGPKMLGSELYRQVVVLLVSHDAYGSIGLVLNRPTDSVVGHNLLGYKDWAVKSAFSRNKLYEGGIHEKEVIRVMHGHALPGAMEVVPGIYLGGEVAAAAEVAAGRLPSSDFRFFSGALVWAAGELEEQSRLCWYTAACCRALVLGSRHHGHTCRQLYVEAASAADGRSLCTGCRGRRWVHEHIACVNSVRMGMQMFTIWYEVHCHWCEVCCTLHRHFLCHGVKVSLQTLSVSTGDISIAIQLSCAARHEQAGAFFNVILVRFQPENVIPWPLEASTSKCGCNYNTHRT